MAMPQAMLGQPGPSPAPAPAPGPPEMPVTMPPMGMGPDPYAMTEDNKTKVLRLVTERFRLWEPQGQAHRRNGWRNILFKRNHQWLVYDRGRAWWRPVAITAYSGPRPTWNRFASTMNAFTSTISRIEPSIVFRPATDEAEDHATAEIAGRVLEVCDEECGTRVNRQTLAQWCGYTGGAWIENGYDPSPEYGMRTIQHETCAQCGTTAPPTDAGTCAMCGGPTQPAVDEMGQPVGHEAPIGRMYEDICTIFEMYFDASSPSWTKGVREYIRKKSSTPERLQERWGDAAKGVSPDMGLSAGEAYVDMLPSLAGFQPEIGPGAGQLMNRSLTNGRISEMYYWSLPTTDYPQGLLVVILGGAKVVHIAPLPYHYDDGAPFLPTVYFPIDPVPGSLYSKTPADDLALVAVTRNKLIANMLMTMDRMAWPIWLMPEGSNVSQITGTPGQVIRYNALGPNADKPERIQGTGLPNGATTWLQYIDHELEELAAAYAGTKGDRAPGVSAGISLQMIEDRKNQRFGGMFILWEDAWAQVAKNKLAIFKQYATEPRLLKIQGRGSQWRVEQFMASDLTGNIDVVAETGSAQPRSTLAQRAQLEQVGAMGAINMADPEVQEKVLALNGMSDLLPSMKADAENAAQQIELFTNLAAMPQAVQILQNILAQAAQMQQQQNQALQQAVAAGANPQTLPPPLPPITYSQIQQLAAQQGLPLPKIRPTVDGHAIMLRELGRWLKGDASRRLPQPIQDVVELKHTEHTMIAQQQMMQQMQMRSGTYPTAGFLNNPGGQQGPSEGPPSRMVGEAREEEQQAQ